MAKPRLVSSQTRKDTRSAKGLSAGAVLPSHSVRASTTDRMPTIGEHSAHHFYGGICRPWGLTAENGFAHVGAHPLLPSQLKQVHAIFTVSVLDAIALTPLRVRTCKNRQIRCYMSAPCYMLNYWVRQCLSNVRIERRFADASPLPSELPTSPRREGS